MSKETETKRNGGMPFAEIIPKGTGGTKRNLTLEVWNKYLGVLSTNGGFRFAAAQAVGISEHAVNKAIEGCPTMRRHYMHALEESVERLEATAHSRATEGVEMPMLYKGEVVAHYTRFSDRMLEVLLKGNAPEKFRDNVSVNANVNGGVLVVPQGVDTDEWMKQYGQEDASTKSDDSEDVSGTGVERGE